MFSNFYSKIIEFSKKYIIVILILVTIISLIFRLRFFHIQSGDYKEFLKPWYDFLKANGGILALKYSLGDYNIPYLFVLSLLTYLPIDPLYAIKLVSVLFDYIGAIFGALIIYKLCKDQYKKSFFALLTYTIIIFLPTVIFNGADWAQCDIIYTTFILISIYFLTDEKYILAFIFYGISFSFKLQAIFILPLFVILYFKKKNISIFYFVLIPLTNIIMCLPAIILGRPLKDILAIYINQTGTYKQLTFNFANIYNLLPNNYELYSKIGIVFTFLLFAIFTLFLISIKTDIDNEKLISVSLWFIIIATYFLPCMHDRYLFAGDILSVLYFINTRKNIYVPIAVNLVSILCYFRYFYGFQLYSLKYISIIYLLVIILFTINVIKEFYNGSYFYRKDI